jgi:PTH1 family peptidyl-tRNA hydrolase
LFLLCGLGNKGSEYAFTRHNIGYLVVDMYSERFKIPVQKRLCGCRVGESEELILAKPNTYMNLSGGPVASLAQRKSVPPEGLVIIHDDIDMDFGRIRIRWNGSDGGHKGVRSVADALRSPLFFRMKIGIGRNPVIPPEEYVLSRFQGEEAKDLADILDRAVDALHTFVFESKEKAMSMYNRS